MCVVSMVGDAFQDRWKDKVPRDWTYPPTSAPIPVSPITPMIPSETVRRINGGEYNPFNGISRKEFDELKNEVLLLKDLLKRAIKYDEANNEPHCETESKIAFLKQVAAAVGVDLEEVFGK